MDIFLSVNNRAEIIQLPIVPSEFKIKSPMNNETFTTINQGDIKLFGESGLKAIVIDCFFPKKDYPFSRSNQYKGWEYVEIIESWKERKLRVRLVATGTPVNIVFAIEDFEYGPEDGSGDIYYSLSLEEFKDIKLQKKAIVPEAKTAVKKSTINAGNTPKKTANKATKKPVKKKTVRKKKSPLGLKEVK